MGKKHKARLNEIKRLQTLHREQPISATPVASETPKTSEATGTSTVTVDTVAHTAIKKDIVYLTTVLAIMIVLLLGASWLVANTGFEDVLLRLFGF